MQIPSLVLHKNEIYLLNGELNIRQACCFVFISRINVSSSWFFYVLKELHPAIFLSKNSVNEEVSLYNWYHTITEII